MSNKVYTLVLLPVYLYTFQLQIGTHIHEIVLGSGNHQLQQVPESSGTPKSRTTQSASCPFCSRLTSMDMLASLSNPEPKNQRSFPIPILDVLRETHVFSTYVHLRAPPEP